MLKRLMRQKYMLIDATRHKFSRNRCSRFSTECCLRNLTDFNGMTDFNGQTSNFVVKFYDVLHDSRCDKDLCPSCSCKMLIDCAVHSERYECFIWKCPTCGNLTFLLLGVNSDDELSEMNCSRFSSCFT